MNCVFASLLLAAHASPAPVQLQALSQQLAPPENIQCLDQMDQMKYEVGATWTQTRTFETGATKGMEGQFRCTCLDNGGISCKSLSLPCIFQDKGYEIGEKFEITNYGESHTDYECACLGQPNGQISCDEINQGCWDSHTMKKYALDTTFEQTRAGDDLIRDCECSGDSTSRLIKCQLTRYCKLNGKYLEIGEKDVIETDSQTQTCTCIEAGRTSCIIEAKPMQAGDEKDKSQIPGDSIVLQEAISYHED